ncbi:conjugal transfer protein TraF [Pseudomonas aeruginosa]|uniref:conjugal transfer protein TraF n=1 Tax=Pseudomonas aeruginosa TaxID=287 RepID=UPI001E2D2FE8|nr:conjugal transfer protein TraF [Pseudomonas aeruginosa]MCC9289584.1 conjugal transfer protein TraF [Pseudomonas aeruginosa]UVN18833.1 F-type type IV secretion, pilus extension and retraction protein [Pseudomonas aeruginosa]
MTPLKFRILLLAAAISSTTLAAETKPAESKTAQVAGSTFYQDIERGWFWYEVPPPEQEPEILEPARVPAARPQAERDASEPAAPELPRTGSVACIREMLRKLGDAAMDNPTKENVSAYLWANRIMMHKAERFSRRSAEVIRIDPLLDEDMRYPASIAASDALATAAGMQKESLLKLIAGSSPLMIFYNGNDCILCDQAQAAVSALEFRYGFTVMPVSMDGAPVPGGNYPNTQYDTRLAELLGIISSPALAVVIPPNDVMIVSFSTVSMVTATTRISMAANEAGLISDQEYNATSRLNTMGLIEATILADGPPDATNNPNEFVNRMRDVARRAFQKDIGGAQ